MARSRSKSASNNKAIAAAFAVFAKLPTPLKVGVVLLGLIAVGVFLVIQKAENDKIRNATVTAGENEFLFCFWNVENLFDDVDDRRNNIDERYDDAFAGDKALRELKYDRIASALLSMNDGKGPDVIACAELESVRSAELLMGTLNSKLSAAGQNEKYQYKHAVMEEVRAGRHIATCVISRVNVDVRNVKQLKSSLRILEMHLYVNRHDLCVIASHWTSKVTQRDGGNGEDGRKNYADTIRDRLGEIVAKDPNADFLLCGDYNDTPDSVPIYKNLGAIGDATMVRPSARDPFLLNLMYGKDPEKFGTLYYSGDPLIYDHIVVSPGMLDDAGWSVDSNSVSTYTRGLIRAGATRREPWRFGNPDDRDIRPDDRGYADHFPVTVKIKVAAE